MTKYEYLEELQKGLSDLPKREVGERINFYGEMIDDRMEEGLSEEEAVLAVGTVEEIVLQISEEIKEAKLSKKSASKRRLRPWEIVLLVLGSPLWLALSIVAFGVGIALYAVLWSLNLCIWVLELPFLAFEYLSKGLFPACMASTKGCWWLTKKGCAFVKGLFGGKE